MRARLPLALVVTPGMFVHVTGCDNVDDHLAAGRVGEACLRVRHHQDEQPAFDRWLDAHLHVNQHQLTDGEVVEVLGGLPERYGDPTAIYDVGATVDHPGAVVEVGPLRSTASLERMVRDLPPLVQLQRAPHFAQVDAAGLKPAPRPVVPRRSRDPLSAIFDAAGAIGMGLGAAVAAPVVALASVAAGFGSMLNAIFGSGGKHHGHASHTDTVAPIHFADPVDQPARLSVLQSVAEVSAAQAAVDAAHQDAVEAVRAEQARRVELADHPASIGLAELPCPTSPCRTIQREPLSEVPVTLFLPRQGARVPDDVDARRAAVQQRQVCEVRRTIASPPQRPADSPASNGPAVVAVDDATEKRNALALTRSLDEGAPTWAGRHDGSVKESQLAVVARGDVVDDLACTIKVRDRRDVQGSPAQVAVLLVAGRDRTRHHSAALYLRGTQASLLVNDLRLVRGERVRVQVGTGHGRSLGGAIETYDGALPLTLENAAFSMRCEARKASDAARRSARLRAERAIEAFVDADAERRQIIDDVGATSSGRDRARVEKARSTFKDREQDAQAAVVAFANLVGWTDDEVIASLKAYDVVRLREHEAYEAQLDAARARRPKTP